MSDALVCDFCGTEDAPFHRYDGLTDGSEWGACETCHQFLTVVGSASVPKPIRAQAFIAMGERAVVEIKDANDATPTSVILASVAICHSSFLTAWGDAGYPPSKGLLQTDSDFLASIGVEW